MKRPLLLGWIVLGSALGVIVFSLDSPEKSVIPTAGESKAGSGGPRAVAKIGPRFSSPERSENRQAPIERPRKTEAVADDFRVSAPPGSSPEVEATARWIDQTARERLTEMTRRYKLTPQQQEKIHPLIAARLPGFSNDMIVDSGPRGVAITPRIAVDRNTAVDRNHATTAANRVPTTDKQSTVRAEVPRAPQTRRDLSNASERPPGAGAAVAGEVVRPPDLAGTTPSSDRPSSPGKPSNQKPSNQESVKTPTAPTPDAPSTNAAASAAPTVTPPNTTGGEAVSDGTANEVASGVITRDDRTLEDELFALLDPDQQALLIDDTLDSTRWWHEIAAQLEAELNAAISAGNPAGESGDSGFEGAPDDNLFDLIGN